MLYSKYPTTIAPSRNYNRFRMVPPIYLNTQTNNRVKIDTGKFCNARCNFCYYLNEVNSQTFLEIKDLVTFIPQMLEMGIREFEFSGGEPTLHPDLNGLVQEIIRIAKGKSITKDSLKFSIVTNGTKLLQVYENIPEIEEFLISIHGTEEDHDKITKIKGSYDTIKTSLGQIKDSGNLGNILIRINAVIDSGNLTKEFMEEIGEYLILGKQVNILPLNFWDNAQKQKKNYSLEDEIKMYNGINLLISYLDEKGILYNLEKYKPKLLRAPLLNIRYPQFCKLSQLARTFARGHVDHYFDLHDWNKLIYPMGPSLKDYSFDTKITESLQKESTLSHYKDKICNNCEYQNCDGLKFINQDKHTILTETEDLFNYRRSLDQLNLITNCSRDN